MLRNCMRRVKGSGSKNGVFGYLPFHAHGSPLIIKSMALSTRPRVMVLGMGERPYVAAEAARLRPAIEALADVIVWDLCFTADLSQVDADLAFVFGGDGSILRAAIQMGYRQAPVLGVNLGKLGFLADLSPSEMLASLPEIVAGKYRVVEHLMFRCRVERRGQVVLDRLGLNEAAVLAGPPFAMLEVHLYVDSELATTYSCDGLIVSTPIGSTAHNLSAGGPILRKDVQAFVISPISPHTLTNRPVVDTAERIYELVVPKPHAGTSLVVDGRVWGILEPDDRVRIERAAPSFKLVEMPGRGYYRTLREKLGWGGTLRLNQYPT
jgi:NAD+ kinase